MPMRLETFILADAVSAPPDGKFYVLGGGISKLNPLRLPSIFPLGILVRFALEDSELLADHTLLIRMLDPDGEDILQGRAQIPIILTAEEPQWVAGEQRIVSAAVNLGSIPISREGIHRITLALDGDPIYERPIPVVVVQPTAQQEALLREFQQRGV
jgi:hypothetical protein